ncbi:MAG: ArnT family glycosyltransferase [Ktedonobacterales bacterium]
MSVQVEPHSIPSGPRYRARWQIPRTDSRESLALPRISLRAFIRRLTDVLLPRRPEYLFVLLVAALLRLVLLDQTSFLGDQAELLFLARSALAHHALPVTGIRSSIGTLNPPASIFLLLPFALLGDPLGATVATAVANIVAVLLLYRLTDRYIGRRAAFAVGLLYATAPWPIYFSRFIWQQNLLAPIVILFIWTLCRGLIDRKRGWLGWNVVLWGIAVQLHPSAAPLLALTALGVVWAWRTVRLRDVLGAVIGLVILFLPTLIWEVVSKGSDLPYYGALGQTPAIFNGDVFNQLLTVLTPPGPSFFGTGTLYWHVYQRIAWLTPLLAVVNVAALIWLLAVVIAGLVRAPIKARQIKSQRKERDVASPPAQAWSKHNISPLATSRLNWRFMLVLLLWLAVPVLAMWRHSAPIHEHYLLAPLPAAFAVLGIFLVWLMERLAHVGERRGHYTDDAYPVRVVRPVPPPGPSRPRAVHVNHLRRAITYALVQMALVAIVVVVASGQAFSAAGQIATVWQGNFDGTQKHEYTHYGLPLAVQQEALEAATAAAKQMHAVIYVATTNLQQESFGYHATESGVHAQIYDAERCLIVPAAKTSPAIVLVTEPFDGSTSAGSLLADMPGVKLLRTLQGQTNTSVRLYYVPAGARLVGEIQRASDRRASLLHLAGYRVLKQGNTPSALVLRWDGTPTLPAIRNGTEYWYGWQGSAAGTPVSRYWFKAQATDRSGQLYGDQRATPCSYLAWGSAETVYALIDVPQPLTDQVGGWHVWVERQTLQVTRPQIGPLHLQSGDVQLGDGIYVPGAATIQR